MYASHGFLRSDIGDVDVLVHDGVFHLFHLVLPNHDFIAHAVSEDGLNWRRVKNALYVGEPGAWDDDMLWTMHVSPDPDRDGQWRMFYTGLSRREYGRVQRVGLATSPDLLEWTRVEVKGYPLEITGEHYESSVDEGRKWVSFRDPFFYRDPDSGRRLLLSSARVNTGPLVRRGCVGVAEETSPGHFEFRAPLHQPRLYDDVEVPNLFQIDGRYFLLGSIREDTKVHYWYADQLEGPYLNFFDNVLLPKGNYAARICRQGDQILLFNFFAKREQHFGREISKKLLPPPKQLVTDKSGRLRLKSYAGFDQLVSEVCTVPSADEWDRLFDNSLATCESESADQQVHLGCPSGYEAFMLPGEYESFRLRSTIALEGSGKCGMVLRVNEQGDGYYLSLDLLKGVAQLRAWGVSNVAETEFAFDYQQLQAGYFVSRDDGPWAIEVLAHGMYLEVSINGYVILSLVDDAFCEGRVGFYTESASIGLRSITVERLHPPQQEEPSGPIYTSAATQPLPDMSQPVLDPAEPPEHPQ
ncbi:MAG: glycosyl hydrolase [Planctomycetota bacterium]